MSENAGDFTAPGTPRTDEQRERGYDEPDPQLLEVGSDETDLDALRAELAPTVDPDAPQQNDDDFTNVEVPLRTGYAVRCRLDFTGSDLDKWRKAARSKAFTDGVDPIKFAALLLGATCVAILRNGRPVLEDGAVVTFATRGFQQTLGAANVDETVRNFFIREGHVDAAGSRVTTEAGWGEQLYSVGPTA